MMGFLISAIAHFWPMWENMGTTVQDIVDTTHNGTITADAPSTIVWGVGQNGPCLVSSNIDAGDDVVISPITLAGSYSVDSFGRGAGGQWTHALQTNDPVNGLNVYKNGVLYSSAAYVPSVQVTGLLSFGGFFNGSLEYFRIWNRPLNQVEIQTLAADPYCMFGISQETLNEMTTIINFMKPTKESWRFVFPG